MESYKKELFVFLLSIWVLFIGWEFQLQSLDETVLERTERYDLLILPILGIVTVYVLYLMLKKEKI